MPLRRQPRRPAGAFTLVELLIVITIIGILIAIFMPIYASVRGSIDRMHCQLNLANCAKIILQYASNNNSWLPNFSNASQSATPQNNNTNGWIPYLEIGIQEDTYSSATQFLMVNELKRYGANAGIFTCPASPAWQDPTYTHNGAHVWSSWDQFLMSGANKQVWTYGYVFMNRADFSAGSWTALGFHDHRAMPLKSSDSAELPLAADSIYYAPSSGGQSIGLYHEPGVHKDNADAVDANMLASFTGSSTDPNAVTVPSGLYPQSGGGNVVFLNGNCQWFDFGDVLPGVGTSPVQTQPMYVLRNQAAYSQYFFGRLPQAASSKLH